MIRPMSSTIALHLDKPRSRRAVVRRIREKVKVDLPGVKVQAVNVGPEVDDSQLARFTIPVETGYTEDNVIKAIADVRQEIGVVRVVPAVKGKLALATE